MAARQGTRRCDLGLCRVDRAEDFPYPIEIDLSFGGELKVSGSPFDEAHAEALLQSRDQLRDGG